MTEQNEIILKEREAQYGSFELNLKLIEKLSSPNFIKIDVGSEPKAFDLQLLNRLSNDFAFIKYMLALKTARSITASGDAYIDCFIDFQNYIKLFIDVYKEHTPEIRIIFNDKFFRYRSHADFLAASNDKLEFNIIKATVLDLLNTNYKLALNGGPHDLKLKQETALNLIIVI